MMTRKPHSSCTLYFITAAGVLLLISACGILLAQSFRVDSVSVDATGTIHLRHAADPNSYYILYRGDEVTSIVTAAQMALGIAGTNELTDTRAIGATAAHSI